MNEKTKCSYKDCERNSWNPIESEQPFCIFHSPRIEDKKDDFKKAWEKFLNEHKDYDGNFINIDCSGFVFPINVSFSDTKFSKIASFSNTKFLKTAFFDNAEFSDCVSFIDAKFFNEASFTDAKFSSKAVFIGAEFSGRSLFMSTEFSDSAFFMNSKFSGSTNFTDAKYLRKAIFNNANFIGVDLSYSSFDNCRFDNVRKGINYSLKPVKWKKPEKKWKLWKYKKLKEPIPPTNFTGIETSGIIASTNRQFIRDIQDQQFINQFKERHKFWYYLWHYSSDCGRSFGLFLEWCLVIALVFGFIYWFNGECWFENYGEWNWITPFYYSIVTFSTLGFGDISPKLGNTIAQFTVMFEVFLGYLGLGGLISILANKLASRA
ncbi:hypothetical protein AMJ80_11785 [bacterium SM23_31]|nr:MAG: hypothetical protein AMJ80_11785 [bacterium SM23_31]